MTRRPFLHTLYGCLEQDGQMAFQEGLHLLLGTPGTEQLETTTFIQGAANDAFSDTGSGNIYLIDHEWTYRVDEARRQLDVVDGLLSRMVSIMDIDSGSKSRPELIKTVMAEMWKCV
ncbi:hypothetical protein NP493_1516g00004 [Ridgeia piscesae]|uniref:Tubulin--tyrosine ligase-like protein 12 SET-like domain-containing protein n=1 Tax=Ridgeia piscesae TaxID=27915 RepID=A0AAD9K242_RIDPI|nr:hypothetical protein NP493_1516g00004 [Ridgeia piscesae]